MKRVLHSATLRIERAWEAFLMWDHALHGLEQHIQLTTVLNAKMPSVT